MSEQKQKLTVLYEKNKNAITFPVTGAVGGATPDNSGIVVNFYVESGAVPHSTDFELKDKNVFDLSSGKSILRGDMVREIQATAFFSVKSARSIANWLLKHCDNLEQAGNEGE